MKRLESIDDLNKLRNAIIEKNKSYTKTVALCGGTGCRAYGSESLKNALKQGLKEHNISESNGKKIIPLLS
ncbi:MAG: (2Fe-2S) ferredoxin domain-containing protein, partial [Candidatus Poribacteria bacterium]